MQVADDDRLDPDHTVGPPTTRAAVRVFLEAASTGDLERVDAYLREGGDVNATLGEGWTALHGAVTRGQVRVLERLIGEHACDLNALTAVGTSALAMALRLTNNVTTRILLDGGASRACVAQDELGRVWDSTWLWPDVRRRLHPDWSIVWTPASHHRFSSQERDKCWLVLRLNHEATRRLPKGGHAGDSDRVDVNATMAAALLAWLTPWRGDENTQQPPRRWLYLPPVVVRLVLEYALYLW